MRTGMIYAMIINVIAFLLFCIDKQRAREHRWRIPEKTLFLAALLGGSPGAILGMHVFHHKTKHASFRIGLPVILILQILLVTLLTHNRNGL